MERRKVNVEEMTKKLNKFRMSNVSKNFTSKELNEALIGLGFSSAAARALAQKCFNYEFVGKSRLYEIPKEPIHKVVVNSVYEKLCDYNRKFRSHNKEEINVVPTQKRMTADDAWQTLIDAGLVKRKFNLELLKSKYPSIYLECLDYEVIK